MATLTINFTPVTNATSYTVCYKPSFGSTWTCTNTTSSSVVITSGITCGVTYNVKVQSDCGSGNLSIEREVNATELPCPPPVMCYTVRIHQRQATGNFILYHQDGTGLISVAVTSLQLVDNYYVGGFCSNQTVELVDFDNIPVTLTDGSTITIGDPCTTNSDCTPRFIYAYASCGLGATACTQQTITLYSECPTSNFGINCVLYNDLAGTSPVSESIVYYDGALWDIDPTSGTVLGQSTTTC